MIRDMNTLENSNCYEISEITARHLANSGVEVYISNRTKHKAEELAESCGCKVLEFEKLQIIRRTLNIRILAFIDVLISKEKIDI